MSKKASTKAEDFLVGLGVNVWKNLHVIDYDGKLVKTSGEESFQSATVIWAAGVKGGAVNGLENDCVIERANRFKVDELQPSSRI